MKTFFNPKNNRIISNILAIVCTTYSYFEDNFLFMESVFPVAFGTILILDIIRIAIQPIFNKLLLNILFNLSILSFCIFNFFFLYVGVLGFGFTGNSPTFIFYCMGILNFILFLSSIFQLYRDFSNRKKS